MEVIPIRLGLRPKQRPRSLPIFFLRTRFLRPFVRKGSSQRRRCACTKPRCIFIKLCIPNFKAGIYLLKIHFRGGERAQQRLGWPGFFEHVNRESQVKGKKAEYNNRSTGLIGSGDVYGLGSWAL